MGAPVAGPVPGLFGKLPAHGDFVRRGWPDETVDAVDRWLTDGIAVARETRDDTDFAAWMHGAPLWLGYVPPGMLGPLALHIGLAPSIDRAGRLFPIAAGVAGDADATWKRVSTGFGAVLDTAIYDALAGRVDADGLVDAIATRAPVDHAGDAPARSAWWLGSPAEDAPVLETEAIDSALLERLLCEGQS
ncbi:type VI secretion system-associated protein TagF [Sphingomonas sp.]|uniref:type VI secretion system-associated protein TagF n=1 Tax=Sphingomonas sp. TaxID=28214 RepID=UPI0035BBDF8E